MQFVTCFQEFHIYETMILKGISDTFFDLKKKEFNLVLEANKKKNVTKNRGFVDSELVKLCPVHVICT